VVIDSDYRCFDRNALPAHQGEHSARYSALTNMIKVCGAMPASEW
jgi:hypothetical protein